MLLPFRVLKVKEYNSASGFISIIHPYKIATELVCNLQWIISLVRNCYGNIFLSENGREY